MLNRSVQQRARANGAMVVAGMPEERRHVPRASNPSDGALLTERQAAAYLRLHPKCLGIWRMQKKGPAFYKLGRAVRYRRSDLDKWLEQCRVG
jgi:excisionase family DNA binding protein